MGFYEENEGITRAQQAEYEEKMALKAANGEKKVRIFGGILLAALIIGFLAELLVSGFSILKLIALLIDIYIVRSLIQGKNWARILYMVFIILSVPSLIVNMLSVFAIIAMFAENPILAVVLAVFYIPSQIINILLIILLFADRDVDQFFKKKKKENC